MNVLRIRLFGGLQLWRGDAPLPAFPTQRSRSLFAYLTLHRTRLHAREALVGHLWAEDPEPAGRKALRMALWRVRSVIDNADEPSASAVRISGTALGFNSECLHWLDLEEFERLLSLAPRNHDAPLDEIDAQRLRAAIDLYSGDLLEDIYDDWCLYERERLRLMYHSALERLMRYEQERAAWGAAIVLGQRLLRLDPLMEQVHRELMRCHFRRGSRASALRQFESCVQTLRRELDVDPMPETIGLYHRIRGDAEPPGAPDTHGHLLLERVDRALDTLHGLAGELETSRDRLRRSPSLDLSSPTAPLLAEIPPRRF